MKEEPPILVAERTLPEGLSKVIGKSNQTLVGIAPAVATVTLIDYLFAADMLMNLEYRLEKLISFSRKSIHFIHDQWGVPEPLNYVVFVVVSLLTIVLCQQILSKLMRRSKSGGTQSYRYNQSDNSEVGALVASVRNVQDDLFDIKKALAATGLEVSSGGQAALDEKLSQILQKISVFDTLGEQISTLKQGQ